MSSRRVFACSLILSGLYACEPPADLPDAGSDAGPTCAPSAFEIGAIEGHATPLGAAAGEVRAGRLRAADLPPDPAGLATWAEGDYVLANDRFAVVVSQPGHFENYDPYGGRVRGLARVRDGALIEPADFNVAILGLGRFVVATEAVTVLSDGSDGAAIVRVSGVLVGVQALADLLEALFPGDLAGLPVALDYVLVPGSDRVDVRVSIRSAGVAARARIGTAGFFQGFRMPAWTEGNGFASASGPQRFGVGLPGVQRVLARLLDSLSRELRVTLSGADVGSIDEARVHVVDASGERELPRTYAPHGLSFEVDPDAAWIWVWREGAPAQGPFAPRRSSMSRGSRSSSTARPARSSPSCRRTPTTDPAMRLRPRVEVDVGPARSFVILHVSGSDGAGHRVRRAPFWGHQSNLPVALCAASPPSGRQDFSLVVAIATG